MAAQRDPALARVPSIADLVPVTEIMTRDITCARRDVDAAQLVELFVDNHIGCVPIVEDPGRPIGMVTKADLVEQLAPGKPSALTANDVMMPFALTLGEQATIAHAAAMMASEDIHHVPILDDEGCLIGIVSSMDIVRWLARNDGFNGSEAETASSH